MNHHRNRRIRFPHRTNSRIDERRNIVIVRDFSLRPEQTVGKFISHLHHGNIDAGIQECLHGFQGVIIDRLLQLLHTVICPCLRLDLFARVCPEIAIVKIEKHAEPCRRHTLCNLKRSFQIILPCAVRFAGLRPRIIPQTDTDGINVIALHDRKEIPLLPVIVILCTTPLQFEQCGQIHSFYKLHMPLRGHRSHSMPALSFLFFYIPRKPNRSVRGFVTSM